MQVLPKPQIAGTEVDNRIWAFHECSMQHDVVASAVLRVAEYWVERHRRVRHLVIDVMTIQGEFLGQLVIEPNHSLVYVVLVSLSCDIILVEAGEIWERHILGQEGREKTQNTIGGNDVTGKGIAGQRVGNRNRGRQIQ